MLWRSKTVTLEEYVQESPPLNTVAIFDWDDTLFPTSWIVEKYMDKRGFVRYTDRLYLQLGEERAFAMVQAARAVGHTFIVTNAHGDGWVQRCLKWYHRHGPAAPGGRRGYQWVEELPLIYAKFAYGALLGEASVSSDSSGDWKAVTFAQIARAVQGRGPLTLWSSVGDRYRDLVVPKAVSAANASAQLFKLIDTAGYGGPIPAQMWHVELNAISDVYLEALKTGGALKATATLDQGHVVLHS